MARNDLRQRLNLLLLTAGASTFLTGLVLLVSFHVGREALAASALGVSRLTWLNLHRLPTLALTAGLALHLWLDRRAFAGQLRRAFAPHGRGAGVELALYLSFWTATLTGLAAWLLVRGASPLAGPIALERLPHGRHELIDAHFLAALVALPLAVHHVAHRWRLLWGRPPGVARRAAAGREA